MLTITLARCLSHLGFASRSAAASAPERSAVVPRPSRAAGLALSLVGLTVACSDGDASSAGLLELESAEGTDAPRAAASRSTSRSDNRAPAPVQGAVLPQSVVAGQLVTLEADSLFSDPDDDSLTFSASSSDPAVVYVVVNSVYVPSPQVAIKAVQAGTADVTVTASDGRGGEGSLTATVTVRANRGPVASGSLPGHDIFVGKVVRFDVSSYFSDPDGDALNYEATPGCTGIIPGCTPVVQASVAGSEVVLTGIAEGRDRVQVAALDVGGFATALFAEVTVKANRSPVVERRLRRQKLSPGDTVTIDMSSYFSDPDGHALTYSGESSAPGVLAVSVADSLATLVGVAEGRGVTLTFTARDPHGLEASLTGPARVLHNRRPRATESLPTSLILGRTRSLDMNDHFRDSDGDALSYVAASSNSTVLAVTRSGSQVTLTAAAVGSAQLTVTARDPAGLESSQTTSVTVARNQPPFMGGEIALRALLAGWTDTLDVSGLTYEPDDDPLVYTATTSASGILAVSMSGSLLTIRGVAPGEVEVTVEARDPDGAEDSLSGTVTVLPRPSGMNQPPFLRRWTTSWSWPRGRSFTLDLDTRFADPEGEALTYEATSSNAGVVSVSQTGNVITLEARGSGPCTITVTATDPGGLSVTGTIRFFVF